MKLKKSILITGIVILLAMITLFGSELTASRQEKGNATTVLARVEASGPISDLPFPIYGHFQGADGGEYVLALLSPIQLEQSGLRFQILDKPVQRIHYYIITSLNEAQHIRAQKAGEVLLDDGRQILIKASPRQAETVAESGLAIRRLDSKPLILSKRLNKPEMRTLAITQDSVISQLMDQVTQTKVQTLLKNLSGVTPVTVGGTSYTIATRNTASGTPVQKATQYVYEYMQNLGLTVSYQNWTSSGYSNRNVIGELPGTTQADEIVLIVGHLDDMPSGATAPGADDNGSGSAGVLLCAEMLKQQTFRRTVRFVLFTGEEQWLLGSTAYADLMYQQGADVVAVWNMDMIGYDGAGSPVLRLHTRTTSNPGYSGDLSVANTFIDVVNAYSLSGVLSPTVTADGITQSDHYPFWSKGYYGVLAIEDHVNDMTPYYHTTSDTTGTINWTYMTNFVKAAVGTAAHLAIRDNGTVTANFSALPQSGVLPLTVNFSDASSGATSWSWNFGDGSVSTAQNPTHIYNAVGSYTVSLTVSNGVSGDTETKTGYIAVNSPQEPVAAFTASPLSISAGGTVNFTDQSLYAPVAWSWSFPGGTPSTSSARNPAVVYSTAGVYDVTLTVSNAQGADSEVKTGYITVVAASYCASKSNNASYEWISRVRVGNLDKSSGASTYSDFTASSASLTRGSAASVTLNSSYKGTIYTEYWRVWIDYNRDGDFLDSGEQVFSKSGKTSVTGTFTPPTSAQAGTTRMRVSMKYGAYATACETFSYGEVEDYTVNIQ